MQALLNTCEWRMARAARKRQRFFGKISGFFLAIALISLFDGLFAQMRSGPNELEMLPGQIMTVSGPAALKNPLASDVLARFTPDNAPLNFELEGFFTGYWFGSGMWRGKIVASSEADPGRYELKISFRGASAQNTQQYVLAVFSSPRDMRAASLSWITRFFGFNPFILAACCGGLGFIAGMATYYFGRGHAVFLARLGLSEIYGVNEADNSILCLCPQNLAPEAGSASVVIDFDGNILGNAKVGSWHKGKLRLAMPDARPAPQSGIVCLAPVEISQNISDATARTSADVRK